MHYIFVEFVDMSTRDLRLSINNELNSNSLGKGRLRVTRFRSLSSEGTSEVVYASLCTLKLFYQLKKPLPPSPQIFFRDPHKLSRTPIQLNYRKGYLIFEFAGMEAADSWVLTQNFPK